MVALALLAAGCSTDVDVNAPVKERAVLFTLIDPALSTQYVRIQRGFLNNSDPNAYNVAKNKDSIYYQQAEQLEVKLFEITSAGLKGKELGTFQPIDTNGKDTGVFYAPDQVVWRATGLKLLRNPGASRPRAIPLVRLVVRNKATNYEATADISLVNPFTDSTMNDDNGSLLTPDRNQIGIRLLDVKRSTLVVFRTEQSSDSSGVYKAVVDFKIIEGYSGGRTDTVYASWAILPEQYEAPNPRGGQVDKEYTGSSRLTMLDAIVRSIDISKPVAYRQVLPNATLTLYAANNDVREYLVSSRQYSAITQTKPYFSNITNGLGLAGSRTQRSYGVTVSNASMDSLSLKSQFRQYRFQ